MKQKIVFSLLLTASTLSAQEKADCNTLDINKVPGKWVWASKAPSFQDAIPASQWKFGEPIRKEMQRIMPVAIDGLYATNSIAFPKGKSFWYSTTSPSSYENYFMLKKYECLKGYNILQPEGATGCWVYFAINQLDGEKFPLSHEVTEIKYHEYESKIRVVNIEIQTDAVGNKILYSQYRPDEILKHCYFFSPRKDLPWRKLTNKELLLLIKFIMRKDYKKQYPNMKKLLRIMKKLSTVLRLQKNKSRITGGNSWSPANNI